MVILERQSKNSDLLQTILREYAARKMGLGIAGAIIDEIVCFNIAGYINHNGFAQNLNFVT